MTFHAKLLNSSIKLTKSTIALNLPPSIVGARCDVLMDIVVVSMAIILPLLWYSMKKVKHDRSYNLHKRYNCICLSFCPLS